MVGATLCFATTLRTVVPTLHTVGTTLRFACVVLFALRACRLSEARRAVLT